MKIKDYFKTNEYIRYSNCHEDVSMLFKYLPKDCKNILSIASGLDNSLALLTTNAKVTAIDSNNAQIALAFLKKTAIKHLNYDECLILLGFKDGDSLNCYNKIRNNLDSLAKDYFDKYLFLITDIKLINAGRFENYFKIFKNKVLTKVASSRNIEKFFEFEDLQKQFEFYNKKINNFRFKLIFKVFFSEFTMKRLGREKSYFKYNNTNLANSLKKRVDLGIKNNLNKNNPYLQYVMLNRFNELPFYLKIENFSTIKQNIDNLTIKNTTLKEQLHTDNIYDFFNLSDVFEYMDSAEVETYESLINKKSTQNASVVFWNMVNERTFSKHFKRINTKQDIVLDRAIYYQDILAFKKMN